MFKLLRFYSITSFIGVLIAGALLTVFYRQVTVRGISDLVAKNNLALAQTALNAVRPALVDYLDSVADAGPRQVLATTLTPPVAEAVTDLMKDAAVARIKIYNRNGIVAFSTKTSQIGNDQRGNPGFIAAIRGQVAGELIYRDSFNGFDGATEEDNLMQTYIPVRAGPTEPVAGVFEIYTDVNHLVRQNERTVFVLLAGVGAILALLYAALLLVVRRAGTIIESQQQTIRERTTTLEILSAQMLKSEETERKRIATELHEGLAQTLSAVKVYVEGSRPQDKADCTGCQSPEAIVPALKKAIQEVRSIAMELRPPSLDELGLLPTLAWYCREFERQHPGIHVGQAITVEEKAVPGPLKIVAYRIVESALKNIADLAGAAYVQLALRPAGQGIALAIEEMPAEGGTGPAAAGGDARAEPDPQMRFADIIERVSLSGGTCSVSRNPAGGIALCASWAC